MVRIATFNASLNRAAAGALLRDLSTPDDAQVRAVAEIIQRVRPDILLLQEFDYDAAGASLAAFQANYLGRSQNGQPPIHYEYTFFTASNTGIPSGFDLDDDGQVGGRWRCAGLRRIPGPVRDGAAVTISHRPTPGLAPSASSCGAICRRPCCPTIRGRPPRPTGIQPQELAVLPLSSKNHWDVPVRIGKRTLHLLISHPTPPAFDGPEDRNGKRNHDEIHFWRDYLTTGSNAYIRDDRGRYGGFRGGDFLVMGDLNSDPVDGASVKDAIQSLLTHPWINSTVIPASAGAVEASAQQGGVNATQGAASAPRHRGLQRSLGRQPASRLSAAAKITAGLRQRSVLAAARACSGLAGVGPTAAELGSPAASGWISLQAQLDAHRTMIRQPAIPGVGIIEHHAHEGFLRHALRQLASQQDGVDVFAVFAVAGAGDEFFAAGDVGEFRGRRLAVVELGVEIERAALRITRRTLLER